MNPKASRSGAGFYVPRSIPIGEAIGNVTSRKKLMLRIKGQSEQELAANISQRGPASTARDLRPGDEHDGSFMLLPLDQIDPYDRNPRTSANPQYAEIKASIRDRGLQGNLTVTKRPGSARYILYMGGNTRLQILQELFGETGENRFRQVNCVYHAWKGEADILASHLIENEARGDTLFIEKARGLMALTEQIERDEGRSLTSREVQELTRGMGMVVSPNVVLLYDFAVSNLDAIGPWLTQDNVSNIKRRYMHYEAQAKCVSQPGEFHAHFAEDVKPLYLSFAEELRQRTQNLSNDAAIVPLRGTVLDELLAKLDALAAVLLKADVNVPPSQKKDPGSGSARAARHKPTKQDPDAALARPAARAEPERHATGPNTQSPVSAPIAPVSSEGPRQTSESLVASALPSADDDAIKAVFRDFSKHLVDWCTRTHIMQWLRFADDTRVPYLFWLDLPKEILTSRQYTLYSIPDSEGNELPQERRTIRAIAYRLIALLSGQLGGVIVTAEAKPTSYEPFARRLPADSTWRQAAMVPFDSMDVLYNVWEENLGGVTARTMDMSLAQDDLLVVLRDRDLVIPWMGLCQAYDAWGHALSLYRAGRDLTGDLVDNPDPQRDDDRSQFNPL